MSSITRKSNTKMEDRHKEILIENRKTLVDDIDVPEIINALIQSKVLSSTLKNEIIKPNTTRQEQVEALLDMLPRRGPDAFEAFCDALKESYEWLVKKLEAAEGETADLKTGGEMNSSECQNPPDLLLNAASTLPVQKLAISGHVQQPADKGDLPSDSNMISVNQPSVIGIPSEIHVHFPHKDAKLVITDAEGNSVNVSLKNCTATVRPSTAGKHRVKIVDNDNVEVSDETCEFTVDSNNPVWKLGSKGSGPGQFGNPQGVAIDRDGNLYVADKDNYRIVKVSPAEHISQFLLANKLGSTNDKVYGIAITNNKEQEIVCTVGGPSDCNTVQVYSRQGELKYEYVNTDMKRALNVCVNSRDQIIVSDREVHAIFIGSRQGENIQWERIGKEGQGPGELWNPSGITMGTNDDIVACEWANRRVQILDKNGSYKNHFGDKGQELGMFFNPTGVAMDEDHNILVSDWVKNVIQVFSYDGQFILCIDSEGDKLDGPVGLAVTGDGHVIVADQHNNCIKKYQYK